MVKIRKTQKSRLSGYLGLSKKHKILVPDFNSCTGPGKMVVSRPKGWKFTSFWIEMWKLSGFLSHFVFLWANNFLGAEFHVFHCTIDNKAGAFVSVSIEILTQSRDYLTHARVKITPIVLRIVDLTIEEISHLR